MADSKKGEGPTAARNGGGEETPPPREEEDKAPNVVGPPKPLGVRIKQEPSDDIKDYAETTMNELLGWYGYTDKVDQEDTAQLTLTSYRREHDHSSRHRDRDRDHPHPHPHSHHHQHHHDDSDVVDDHEERQPTGGAGDDKVNGDDKEQQQQQQQPHGGEKEGAAERREMPSSESGESEHETGRLSVDSAENRLADPHRSLVTTTGKSREEKGAEGAGGGGGGGGGGVSSEEGGGAQYIVCAWCQKPGMKLFTLRTPAGTKAFCSEVCFTQCRRASFKKNKVCDWCKHVRHTVNFVDFQDGENQLQFCSEKCLNQYKMNIFCTETQEHLKQIQSQLNEERKNAALSPGGASSSSLSSKGMSDAASASSAAKKIDEQILITPELWLAKHHSDKVPKTEVVDVDEEVKEEEDKGRKKNGSPSEGKERRSESQSSDRSRSREVLLDRKRLSQPLSAAGAAAAVASYTNSLHLSKSGPRLLPGTDRALERSSRDRERVRRLFRDSGSDRDSRPLPHPSDSPASSSQFSPPSGPQASDTGTPPMVPPMLLPHLNGLGAGIAGLGLFNPLLCSSLFGPVSGDGRHEAPRSQSAHTDRERKEESGTRARSGDRVSLSSTPGAIHSSSSPANTASSSGTPNPPQSQHPPPPPFPHAVPPLNGPAGFPPQGLHPPPFMLGMPPFAYPPGFFPPDPAAMMGGLLALQGTPPAQPAPPPLRQQQPPPQHHRDRAPPQRPRGEGEVPLAATAGCLNAGVPPVTVMMPFPVVLPIPVPIPIPLPIAPEKIQQFFKERDHPVSNQPPPHCPPSLKTSSSSERQATRSHSPCDRDRDRDSVGSHHSSHSQFLNHSHSHNHHHSQQRPDSVSSDSSCHSPSLSAGHRGTPTRCHEVHTPGCLSCATCRMFPRPGRQSIDSIMTLRKNRESADSIMTLRRESGRSLMAGEPPSLPPKRSLTPVFPVTLDLSKRARLDENRNNEDEAIDLSKDSRSSTPARSVTDFSIKSSHSTSRVNGALSGSGGGGGSCSSSSSSSSSNGSVASGKENQQVEHDMASIDGDSESGLKVPKIHIIDSRDDPPLAQPLPLPPADHAYSMRRSLILDAPSVPKPPRSPSPERRYVRTVPRDMVEAAKRRCLRARVRTK